MDQSITQWVNGFAGTSVLLDWIMITASEYSVPLLILLVAVQWWSKRARHSIRHTCVAAGLSFLIGLAVNQIILLFVHRIRPYDAGLTHLIITRSGDWSFPSDHATASFAIVTTFLLRGVWRRGFFLLVGAIAVSLSRIYVGTHYASDVLGGAVTGAAAAVAVFLLYWEGTRVDRFIVGIL
ncbi:MAG TPA: phosphatase PAP2 family protein [Pseudolabrys sp.]|nr:phosphatase PAP2 family protein [Pseudolabrys sp.]